jgi:hypothetical protein
LHQFNCDSINIVMIVSVTRSALRGVCRDKFDMADEAFALSPISARATLPSEEDYEAIREAFMETSRGRWFLGEYTKRNRNADTRLVLDAVARIEETMAAQRQPEPVPDNSLVEALAAAIKSALDEARAAASSAIDGLALEQNLAPVRKGTRVIREISWRLREIGADARICDLIDSQLNAIEGACGQISPAGPKDALSAAFDLIESRIGQFHERDAAAPAPRPEAEASSSAVTPGDAEVATDAKAAPAKTPQVQASPVEAVSRVEAVVATPQATNAIAEAADSASEAAEEAPEDAAARDQAILDLIALEMAEPASSGADELAESEAAETRTPELHTPALQTPEIRAPEIHSVEPTPADPVLTRRKVEPVAMATPAQPEAMEPSLQPSLPPAPEPSPEPSLGSTILANGIVRRPKVSSDDPLASIRRMSQAEVIAFFS